MINDWEDGKEMVNKYYQERFKKSLTSCEQRITPLSKKIIIKIFSLLGLKISLIRRNVKWLQNMDIKTVIDVGANIGQAARMFHDILPNAFIYSFEPLHECFLQLNSNMVDVPNFKAFNIALGDKEGEKNIYRNEDLPSSSLLKMNKLCKKIYPFASRETIETIEVKTLDSVVNELALEDNILLKIDVQGFEERVLRGGMNTLSRVKVIIIETMFQELYEGQPLFSDTYDFLQKMGFIYSGNFGNESKSPIDGATLQADSIFIKKPTDTHKTLDSEEVE